MNEGWIKIHRKIMQSPMYRNLNAKQRDVMFSLLLMANYKENQWQWKGEIFTCQPGQIITSLDSIKNNCAKDVKVQSVRTALLKLEKWHFLTNESTKMGRLITILNWDTYQEDSTGINNMTNKGLTKHQQRANKELTTNKKVKKVKKVNNINIPFEDFWILYDYKKNKPRCQKLWLKLKDKDRIDIMAYLPEYIKRTFKDRYPNRKYPEGFLNGRRWEDEIPEIQKSSNLGVQRTPIPNENMDQYKDL